MNARQVATSIAATRAAYGALCLLAPKATMRVQTGTRPDDGPFVYMTRIFGIRDAVLGAGALVTLTDPARSEAARLWVQAGAVADALDSVSSAVAGRHLGRAKAWGLAAFAASAAAAGFQSAAALG